MVNPTTTVDQLRGKVVMVTGANARHGQAKISYDEDTARRLWQVSAELTHLEENRTQADSGASARSQNQSPCRTAWMPELA